MTGPEDNRDHKNSERRALRGPHVVIAFLVLATAGVIGGWMILRQHPTPTRIVDVMNLDGEHAVMVREVRGPDERSFVSLYARERGEVWGALIPRYAGDGQAHSAVAATADVVFVRGTTKGQAAFFAFSSDGGQKLGRIEPYTDSREPADSGFVVARTGGLFGDGEAFEISGVPGSWLSILAFGLEDGTLSWRLELDPLELERVWLRARHLVLRATGQVFIIRRDSGGLAARIETEGPVCLTQESLYSADAGQVLARPLDRPDQTTTLVLDSAGLVGACGVAGSRTLLAMTGAAGDSLVALDERDAIAWRVELPGPGRWLVDPVAEHTPDRVPFGGGQVTRFAPVLVAVGDSSARLILIDTIEGRIARQSPTWDALDDAHLMTVDERHYLYVKDPAMLAVFDGATGDMVAARTLASWNPVWPRQVAGGRIWVSRDAEWAVLDAATLAPMPGAGVSEVGRDTREDMSRQLGW